MTEAPALLNRPILNFLLPSVRDIVFIALFWALLAGPLASRPLADADIGWHIRTGEQILTTKSVPRTDPFSSAMQGRPWIAWEWLYDVVLGVLHGAMGLNGVVWLAALIISGTFAILFSQLLKRGTGVPLALLLLMLSFGAASIHLFARPHIVSWLFSLLWFIALERWAEGDTPWWLLWFFPASMVLWVNLHAGWLFGLALLVTYCGATAVESLRSPDPFARIGLAARTRGMAVALVGSVLATLVNPYGWRLHAHIYRYLGDRYLIDRIDEFHSPDFHGWAQRFFALLVVLGLIAFAGSRESIRLRHVLVTLLAIYSGMYASRSLPVSSMLLTLIVGPLLWKSLASFAERPGSWGLLRRSAEWLSAFAGRAGAQEFHLHGHALPALAVLIALLACLHGGTLGGQHVVHAQFDPQRLPIAAAEYLAQEPDDEPVLAPDLWGGYLIYRLYPQRRVVIDDRHDLYGADRFRDYLTLMQVQPGWKDVLEKWHVRTLVLPTRSTLANILRELPQEWRVAHEDGTAIVLEKRE
jgi:hypothetical protein